MVDLYEVLHTHIMGDKARKTEERFLTYLKDMIRDVDKAYLEKCFNAVEEVNAEDSFAYDQLIVTKEIEADLMCPHHLLPVELTVWIGYMPDKKMLGLSKFARVAKEMTRPARTQEQYTADLAKMFFEQLECNWCMVLVKGSHGCMRCRGVKARSSEVITSAIQGDKRSPLKQEFLELVKLQNGSQ